MRLESITVHGSLETMASGSERHDPSTSPAGSSETGGRLPEHVYRRRRMVALAVIVALALALLWAVVSGVRALTGAGAADEATPTQQPGAVAQPSTDPQNKFADFSARPTPSGSGTSSSPSASSTAAPGCGADLVVGAATDKQGYAAGEDPVLELVLENKGQHPCRVNAGSNHMALVVTSGADTVFDSRHCAVPGEDRQITLGAGQKETARLTWNRVRTAEGCPTGQSEALPGYYNLTASLGDVTSQQVSFNLQ